MCAAWERTKINHYEKQKKLSGSWKYVKEEIIEQNQAVSMAVLHELYELEIVEYHYRNTLKKWLQETFPEQWLFLPPKPSKRSC